MTLQSEQLDAFVDQLREDEKSDTTVEKYKRDVIKLFEYLGWGKEIQKSDILAFKEELKESYKGTSVNSILAAVNGFLKFTGMKECRVKQLRVQQQSFREEERELTRDEYIRLVKEAEKRNNERISLVMQTICATGIRVSEIPYITVEAVRAGVAEVHNKGKSRIIMIPSKLRRVLRKYIKRQKIVSGYVFRTKNGNPMDRSNIWKSMKALCEKAGVDKSKVFPHNLRHLFAMMFYQLKKDLVKLADILGHSQIETTRIYTRTTGQEHKREINALNLVL